MKFSQHIGKGIWAFASRGLPLLYAVVFILIINVLPSEQYGTLAVVQSIFGLLFTFSDNFALQAIVKFGVEPDVDVDDLVSTTSVVLIGFFALVSMILMGAADFWGGLLHNPLLPELIPLLILMIVFSLPRTIIAKVFQMRFQTKQLFFLDLSYFGTLAIAVSVMLSMGKIHTARDVMHLMVVASGFSSLVGIFVGYGSVRLRARFSRVMAQKVLGFGKFQSVTGLAAAMVQYLDTLLVSGYTGPTQVAIYNSAKTLYRIYDIVRDTAGIFIFPASSKYHSRGDTATLKTLLEKATSFLYLLLIPMSIGLILFAQPILHFIFQGRYDEAIPIFRILSLSAVILPIYIVFSTSTIGFGLMKKYFRVVLVSSSVTILSALTLLPLLGIEGAAIAYILGVTAQALQLFPIIRKEVPFKTSELFLRGFRDSRHYFPRFVANLRSMISRKK